MDPALLAEGKAINDEIRRINKFTLKYKVTPYKKFAEVYHKLRFLHEQVPQSSDIMTREFQRRILGRMQHFERHLSGEIHDFTSTIKSYGIEHEDLAHLQPWLQANQSATLNGIERLYEHSEIADLDLGLQSDIPSHARSAKEFSTNAIEKYHEHIGKLIETRTGVSEFLCDITAHPTQLERSYFNSDRGIIGIAIPAICYTNQENQIVLREEAIIRLLGHEGMGHALNDVLSKQEHLPYFLSVVSTEVVSTMESVALHYEQKIFDDIQASPETQKALGIDDQFDKIYEDAQDVFLLQTYAVRLHQFGILVLADPSLGQPGDPTTMQRKAELIQELALYPNYGVDYVEGHRGSFDSRGNLNPRIVGELRYVARPVERAIQVFANAGLPYDEHRSLIDRTLLEGYWTNQGLVEQARAVAARNTVVTAAQL